MLVLGELEIWPNLIRICSQQQVSVAVVNARLSENSFRGYHKIRFLIGPILRQIDLIASQNQTYADRFMALGAHPNTTVVTGSIKFDGAETDRANPRTQSLRQLAGIQDSDVVLLAGSTQSPEEQIALNCYLKLKPEFSNLRLIIVPRHPARFDIVAKTIRNSKTRFTRRSQLMAGMIAEPVLLVDTIGELSAWWGISTVAFVGGSMGNRGGQNMIEPAAYGAAVCFGPNTRNFRDIVEQMLRNNAARVVSSESELLQFVRKCLESDSFAASLGLRAKNLVRDNAGALNKTIQLISPTLVRMQRAKVWSPMMTERSRTGK
jgi:3-deoxy-D-manno-octulosonic-acid transferase